MANQATCFCHQLKLDQIVRNCKFVKYEAFQCKTVEHWVKEYHTHKFKGNETIDSQLFWIWRVQLSK